MKQGGVLMPQRQSAASIDAKGTGVLPNPSLMTLVPAELWATPAVDFGPVFPAHMIDTQSNFPRAGPPIPPNGRILCCSISVPRSSSFRLPGWPTFRRHRGNLGRFRTDLAERSQVRNAG